MNTPDRCSIVLRSSHGKRETFLAEDIFQTVRNDEEEEDGNMFEKNWKEQISI
jgi:hypothetical protein